jgi:hypothetical protein
MVRIALLVFLALLVSSAVSAADLDRITLEGGTGEGSTIRLVGREAHQQLLVTAHLAAGELRDVTRAVRYNAEPTGIVQISPGGDVTPLHDGTATITATAGKESTANLKVNVQRSAESLPINFANQIVPVFTKAGCNTGGCHGKSSGQNGFRLSLLGFEPGEDYEHLVAESRGRRLSPAAPEHSLLLLKATGIVPHGGGKRIDVASEDYRLLARWISQGMPQGNASDPSVASIEVIPASRTLPLGSEQQLLVIARYTDGSIQDVTRNAVCEASDKEMGSVDTTGHVNILRQPGSFSVMVRYQGKVATFQATLPLGAPVDHLPAARNFVDELVFKQLKAVGMPPSDVCDDATFLRRVTLDIAGRLPTIAEVRSFREDPSPTDKRDRCIDRLLDSADYADFFANTWSALLRNRRAAPNHQRGNYLFHDWIRECFYTNVPYDHFVRAILTASGDVTQDPPAEWYRQATTPTAQLEDTAQLFLGTRIQCAQCHHHPYEKWSQQDYYGLSAFFSQVARKPAEAGEETIYARRATAVATNIKTGQPVKATGLGAKPAELTADDDARQALVDWMVAPDNRFFAPALANRYWKHFLGRGLVEPEDDMRETNPPTNPELLRALADHFVASHYDLKDLIRTICRSSAYQLSAIPNRYNGSDKQYYSRYYPKRLNAEVLLDSVDAVAASNTSFSGLPAGTRAVQLPDNSFNAGSYFLTVFGRPESSSACECERSQDASLAQSLHLLNSKEILGKISADSGRAAKLAAGAPSASQSESDGDKIRELYLLAYSREPAAQELDLARKYVTREVRDKDGKLQPVNKRSAYEDIVWAMINTKEFLFNH